MKKLKIWEFLLIFSKIFGSTLYGIIFLIPMFIKAVFKSDFSNVVFIFFALAPILYSLSSFEIQIIAATISNFLFYFSILLIYPIYRSKNKLELIRLVELIIKYQFIFNLLEFLVLNSPASQYLWYFPDDHPHRALIFGWQKSLGLCSLSSSSGFLAVFLLIVRLEFGGVKNSKKLVIYTLGSVLLLMSGTGFFILSFYSFFILFKSKSKSRIQISLAFILILIIGQNFSGINKFSLEYFSEIIVYKMLQINSEVNIVYSFENLFGRQLSVGEVLTSGDFGFLNIFLSMGVYGMIIFIMLPFLLFQKEKILFTVLVISSAYHYPALTGGIGGIAYALAATISRK